jgi:hypothetical protein
MVRIDASGTAERVLAGGIAALGDLLEAKGASG